MQFFKYFNLFLIKILHTLCMWKDYVSWHFCMSQIPQMQSSIIHMHPTISIFLINWNFFWAQFKMSSDLRALQLIFCNSKNISKTKQYPSPTDIIYILSNRK